MGAGLGIADALTPESMPGLLIKKRKKNKKDKDVSVVDVKAMISMILEKDYSILRTVAGNCDMWRVEVMTRGKYLLIYTVQCP